MEFRDPIHGPIIVFSQEEKIIGHPFFQRLRHIKQLGLSDYSFPAATHTRFLHSLGCMHVATKAFDRIIFQENPTLANNSEWKKLASTLRLAALLHDIGHAPLSHSTEIQMPKLSALNMIDPGSSDRQATHEDYTVKAITDSFFTETFDPLKKSYGVEPHCIAELISGTCKNKEYFCIKGIDYFPFMHQLISSEMDCDRMDYLLRDSYFCGVTYGKFDLHWMLENMTICIQENKAYLGLQERAISAFDHFLLGRYHMFLMVYFHFRSTCLEKLLHLFFTQAPDEYRIPSNIEDYLYHDDHYLYQILKNSHNNHAKRIINNDIPTKYFESFNQKDHPTTHKIHEYLTQWNIPHIYATSMGRLSKYNNNNNNLNAVEFPIKIYSTNPHRSTKKAMDLNIASDLFLKFQEGHTIKRIHFEFENLSKEQKDIIRLLN